jgi:hypothetical protein
MVARPPAARRRGRHPARARGRFQAAAVGAQGKRDTGFRGLTLEPPGPLLTHLHTIYIWYILSALPPA